MCLNLNSNNIREVYKVFSMMFVLCDPKVQPLPYYKAEHPFCVLTEGDSEI